ncbi:nucleotidyltransferase domain-containing protein [Persephonella sp. KM09-Lau-8]|uniref:DNA polymerase beta superfamily protein n=1 Tax=Persephonella sp. KM09-Lau-8 TaxID=1158345 RepID=UPI000ADFEFF9|nr:nucleotidyltransferase domain-containing protein [Persephonella sp. KM09-Lau-8]
MDEVLKKLEEIRKENNITILYACESGSRAWGFESPDSDYDIRFIYVNKLDYYLFIQPERDTIEITEEPFDFVGWDLKKALSLLRKSNPSIIEWLNSPIIYKKDEEFFQKIKELANLSFNPKAMMYHYLSMAKTNYRTYLKTDQVKIKKYFYVIRPILSLIWIEKNKTIPPIKFEELFNQVEIEEKVRHAINNLLVIKKQKRELDLYPRIEKLNQFIEEKLEYYEQFLKSFELKKELPEIEKFNHLLKEMIFKYDKKACYSLEKLKNELKNFVKKRQWEKYHTLKNLAVSVSIESAELLEHFQWWDKKPEEISEEERKEIGYEIADIFTYLLHLSEKLGIDILKITEEKLEKTKQKYPVERFKGNYEKPK